MERILLLLVLFFITIDGKFVRFGPCIIRWGEECPDPHINFYLYTRKNKEIGEKILPNETSINESTFNPSDINKIIIHGYNSDMNLTPLVDMKNGYLETGNYNVWMVDWMYVAQGPCYPIVVSNVNYVSKCVSQLVQTIIQMSTLQSDTSIHVIGFSVGAHVAGYLANHIKPIKLARITGLDPALPLFVTSNKDHKLDKTDALFVDVFHTDALTEGQVEESGHVDFYINGGIYQPGCWNGNLFDTTRCNHNRAPIYFAESITSTLGFFGWKCTGFWDYIADKCPYTYADTLMGEYCSLQSRGYYIVRTSDRAPFAIGHNVSSSIMSENWMMKFVTLQKQAIFNTAAVFEPNK